jgi:nicotinamidase-related amidase
MEWFKRLSQTNSSPLGTGDLWYHGSPKRFESFATQYSHTFGSGPSETPLFFSKNKDFVRGYAGGKGHIYTVRLKINKTFDGENLFTNTKFWPPTKEQMTPIGQQLYDDLENNKIFSNLIVNDENYYQAFQDSQGILASILNMHYDVMETKEMKEWLKKHDFDSFYVTGDGEKNLAVINPSKIEIVSVEPAYKLV